MGRKEGRRRKRGERERKGKRKKRTETEGREKRGAQGPKGTDESRCKKRGGAAGSERGLSLNVMKNQNFVKLNFFLLADKFFFIS